MEQLNANISKVFYLPIEGLASYLLTFNHIKIVSESLCTYRVKIIKYFQVQSQTDIAHLFVMQ